MRVYKYVVFAQSPFALEFPLGAKFLSVQTQRGAPQAWFLVDEKETRTETRMFYTIGTGHDLPAVDGMTGREWNMEFLGTFQLSAGEFVFHLFEGTRS